MRLIRIIVLLMLLAGASYSCIEPYEPETKGYEEMLLIEGIISDDSSVPARVSISKTISFSRDKDFYEDIPNAYVRVVCDDGTDYPLTETSPGLYENLSDQIIPEPGKFYKLFIETVDHLIFQSEYEPFIPGSPIDSIIYRADYKELSEFGDGVYGLQFYANSSGRDNNPIYLRWLLNATYKYRVPYVSEFVMSENGLLPFSSSDFAVCWKDIELPGIYISDTYGLTENKVVRSPLNFVSQFGDQLSSKYSLEVTQLSISKAAYKFWYDLNKIINETGGLYETQPFRLSGNITCTSDPDISVSGIFEVAGITKSRVFTTRPTEFRVFPQTCRVDTVGTETYPLSSLSNGDYIFEIMPGVWGTSSTRCFICTERGGYTIRPAFWE